VNSIRQFCAAFLMTFLLAIPAFSGDMGFPGVNRPAEQPPPAATTAGEILTPGATGDPVIEIALGFLLDVSSLL
jgi:hypothetical protein